MGEGEDPPVKNTVELSPRCATSYKKLAKKADPGLRRAINRAVEGLKEDPYRGKKLVGGLEGMRSVRVGALPYRVVYQVVKGGHLQRIIVHAIAHRSKVYGEAAGSR